MKICGKCKTEKPLTEFYKDKTKKDGLTSNCKVCKKAFNKAYREANKERLAERSREYREANRERKSEYMRDYYEANRERRVEYQREYYEANRERVAERMRDYYDANRERLVGRQRDYHRANFLKYREYQGRKRAEKAGAPVGHADYELVVATSNGLCGICGEPIFGAFDLDHIVPLANGGAHSTDNLQVAHHHCNVAKSDKEAA